MQPRRFLALLAATLTLLPAVAHAVPPVNDNFANRIVLSGQAVSSGPITVDEATREGLERSDTGNQTLWWTWTAPQDGIVTLTDQGTTYDGVMTAFNGMDLANLVLIARNDSNGTDSLTFAVRSGLTYQICLGAYNSNVRGNAILNLRNAPPTITTPTVIGVTAKTNDNFANAIELPGSTVSGFTYIAECSRENQEPPNTGNQTVWWTWVAPADVQVTMTTDGSGYDTVLSIFNGTNLASLSRVRRVDQGQTDSATFPAKAGTVFKIAVGSYNSGVQSVSVLNITTAPLSITSPEIIGSLANANDNYANAQSLGSFPNSFRVGSIQMPAWSRSKLGPTATIPSGGSGPPRRTAPSQ